MTDAIGYIRVSTERQASEDRTSLADQEHAIKAKAAKLGATLTGWYRDEGASGATVEGRPEFRRLLADCEAQRRPATAPGYVLVLNDSRFGRFDDPEEAAYWRHHLRRLGWIVRFAEGDESDDLTSRSVMRAIGSAQASEYRRNLMQNSRRGMRGSANNGYWTREAPYGYRRVIAEGPRKGTVLDIGQLKAPNERVKLTPHAEEAKIVAWMFESYVSREHSASSLARELPNIVPHRRWSPHVVHSVLRNPAYCGDVVSGRRAADGADYGMRDAHPPVVSRELWEAAQDRMSKNRKLGRATRTSYLLTGLLRCTYCGEAYVGGGGGKSLEKVKVREFRRFYRDSGGLTHKCPGRIGTVMRHIVDDAVIETLSATLGSKDVQRRIAREIDRVLSAGARDRSESVRSLKATKARLEQRKQRLVAAVADGTLTAADVKQQLGAIRSELAAVEARLLAPDFGKGKTPACAERERLVALAADFPRAARRLSGPQLRALVEPWLAGAEFDKATRELTLSIRPLPASLLADTRQGLN